MVGPTQFSRKRLTWQKIWKKAIVYLVICHKKVYMIRVAQTNSLVRNQQNLKNVVFLGPTTNDLKLLKLRLSLFPQALTNDPHLSYDNKPLSFNDWRLDRKKPFLTLKSTLRLRTRTPVSVCLCRGMQNAVCAVDVRVCDLDTELDGIACKQSFAGTSFRTRVAVVQFLGKKCTWPWWCFKHKATLFMWFLGECVCVRANFWLIETVAMLRFRVLKVWFVVLQNALIRCFAGLIECPCWKYFSELIYCRFKNRLGRKNFHKNFY